MNGIETHDVKDTENKYKEGFLKGKEGRKSWQEQSCLPKPAGTRAVSRGSARAGLFVHTCRNHASCQPCSCPIASFTCGVLNLSPSRRCAFLASKF